MSRLSFAVRCAALSALLVTLLGCGGAGLQLITSPEEFHSYRVARAAPELEGRLVAITDYLERYPDGAYAEELRRRFAAAEPGYYQRMSGGERGLRRYLELLPSGPHAEAAQERLAVLARVREVERQRDARLDAEAAALASKLSQAEAGRERLIREYSRWLRLLSEVSSFGQTTSELSGEWLRAWRAEDPPARCRADTCTKLLNLEYVIPAGKRLRARSAVFDVSLRLEGGLLVEATLTGSRLFDRLGEALSLTPVGQTDALARVEAIARVVQLSSPIIERRLPEARCGQEAVGAVLIRRQCEGVVLELVAAEDDLAEDRVVLRPAPADVEVPE